MSYRLTASLVRSRIDSVKDVARSKGVASNRVTYGVQNEFVISGLQLSNAYGYYRLVCWSNVDTSKCDTYCQSTTLQGISEFLGGMLTVLYGLEDVKEN